MLQMFSGNNTEIGVQNLARGTVALQYFTTAAKNFEKLEKCEAVFGIY